MSKPSPVLFFFSSINPNEQGYIEAFGNWLLRPIQVLTGMGREYRNNYQETFELRGRASDWVDTIISIAALPLSLIFGPIVLFFAHSIDPRMREDEKKSLSIINLETLQETPLKTTIKRLGILWRISSNLL